MSKRIKAAIDFVGLDARLVERPGPGLAPTAFRIWRAGDNPTDHGATVFSRRSSELLTAQQAERANLFSIDVDHLSLSPAAPPEARRAVGWHRLAVRADERGEPELWAVEVQWTELARCGLEANPPEWRYFSPAYDVDEETREVLGYLNTALTNNPATWGVTALATRAPQRRDSSMATTFEDVLAALRAMAEGDDEGEKSKAAAMLAALEEPPHAEPDGDEEPKAEADTAEGEPDGDEPKPEPEAEKASIKASADPVIALAAEVQALRATVERLSTRDERARLLASRPDLAPSVRRWLASAPLATVRDAIKALPVQASRKPAADVTPAATRGATSGNARGSRLTPEERRALDERMGLARRTDSIRREGSRAVFGVLTADEAKLVAKGEG